MTSVRARRITRSTTTVRTAATVSLGSTSSSTVVDVEINMDGPKKKMNVDKDDVIENDDEQEDSVKSLKRKKSTKKTAAVEEDGTAGATVKRTKSQSKNTASSTVTPEDGEQDVKQQSPAKRKKKAKAEAIPPSTTWIHKSSPWKVGAHVSSAGGVENAVWNAARIGANAFALFLKSQRKWFSPALSEESIQSFRERVEEYGYDAKKGVLPHGSYLINLGNPDGEKRKKAYGCFLDDLKRCEQLGIGLYNFHPGSTVGGCTPLESIEYIAQAINDAHRETKEVTVVIENMAGSGNVIGGKFEDIGDIVKRVENKERVGVCLDTCHMFAAGYDIRTKDGWDSMLESFDTHIGLHYLRGMHLNDSKAELGSKKDRHENIGLGHLGLDTFTHIIRDPRTQHIPLILETPTGEREEVWAKEIDVLQRLSQGGEQSKDALVEEIRTVANIKMEKGAKKGRKRKRGEMEAEDEEIDEDSI